MRITAAHTLQLIFNYFCMRVVSSNFLLCRPTASTVVICRLQYSDMVLLLIHIEFKSIRVKSKREI